MSWAPPASEAEYAAQIEEELNLLTAEYAAWNKSQALNLGSADEHLFDADLTEDQRRWLADFCGRWDSASPVFFNGTLMQHRDLERDQ